MPEHYYSEKQTSKLNLGKIRVRLRNHELEFWTGSGVFSGKKVDKGSELLANDSIIKEGWRVLDLGCGYGAVGIAVAKAYTSSEVVLTDINQRAVKLSRMNRKLNKAQNVSVVQGNMYERVNGKFDTILLNPPQTAGREICFKMIENAKKFLNKGGMLQIVARHKKGGKLLSDKMKSVFGNVEEISKKSGYRIYISRN
ncbi:class I SAM-dependent methyltransferase [Candidatus Woesearchaeota archaeon]|nr:class I SAM-dependent methyltransferase [Candidatus Woesearchaeota archaeon]